MRLTELKQETYDWWVGWQKRKQIFVMPCANPTQDNTFKAEVRKLYEDLRLKTTWIKAFAWFEAQAIWSTMNGYDHMVQFWLIEMPHQHKYANLVPTILEAIIMIPYGLDAIINGLRKTFQDGLICDITRSQLAEFVNHALQVAPIRRELVKLGYPDPSDYKFEKSIVQKPCPARS